MRSRVRITLRSQYIYAESKLMDQITGYLTMDELSVTVRIIQPHVDKQRLIDILQREHGVTVRFCCDLVPEPGNPPFLECEKMQLDTAEQREHLIHQCIDGNTRIDGQIISVRAWTRYGKYSFQRKYIAISM